MNANIAMVSSFSLHEDRAEAIRRGAEGFEFFGYALASMVTKDQQPGRTDMWGEFIKQRGDKTEQMVKESQDLVRSEEHTSELQSRSDLVCRLLLEKKNISSKVYTPAERVS